MTSTKHLQELLDRVARGEVDPNTAREEILEVLRAQPYEDLGMARVTSRVEPRLTMPDAIAAIWAGVLPKPRMTSGNPWRRER